MGVRSECTESLGGLCGPDETNSNRPPAGHGTITVRRLRVYGTYVRSGAERGGTVVLTDRRLGRARAERLRRRPGRAGGGDGAVSNLSLRLFAGPSGALSAVLCNDLIVSARTAPFRFIVFIIIICFRFFSPVRPLGVLSRVAPRGLFPLVSPDEPSNALGLPARYNAKRRRIPFSMPRAKPDRDARKGVAHWVRNTFSVNMVRGGLCSQTPLILY